MTSTIPKKVTSQKADLAGALEKLYDVIETLSDLRIPDQSTRMIVSECVEALSGIMQTLEHLSI